jgi:hypothetical protein
MRLHVLCEIRRRHFWSNCAKGVFHSSAQIFVGVVVVVVVVVVVAATRSTHFATKRSSIE